MKKRFFLPVIFFICLALACNGQVMKTISYAVKLKSAEQNFIGKPLSKLLSEIKPQITKVKVITGEAPIQNPGFFRFQFQSAQTIDSLKSKNKTPTGIVVYIKEAIDWNYINRPTDEKNVWTKDDAKRYGRLTVSAIRILGNE